MRPKITPKAILIPTISLFLICVVVTALLAVTNNITAEKIAANEAQSKQESMFSVVPGAASFEEIETDVFYAGKDASGNIVGYAVSTAMNGYGGLVKVMTGFDANGVILGVDVFYNDDETPGLGKNTSNASFRDQFAGFRSDENIVVSKDADADDFQTVDAVTSATISSRAVTGAVNKACAVINIYFSQNNITKEAE